MAPRLFKNYSQLFFAGLFAALCWTYFQPAIQIQISGIPASHWSAHELTRSFYHSALKAIAPQRTAKPKIKIPTSFIDFLKKLFPQKKHEFSVKAYAGLVFGILIPITFLLAYLSLVVGTAASFVQAFKNRGVFFTAAVFLSLYALVGILALRVKAHAFIQASTDEASHSLFSFITRSFVQQIGVEPGIALVSLPMLAAAFWLLSALRKK